MKSNDYCSAFPDSWHFLIEYDISFACALHDYWYETGEISRAEADWRFYQMLMKYNQEYKALWYIVYKAVRMFGILPWISHRLKSVSSGLINLGIGWTKARQHLARVVGTPTSAGQLA